MAYIVTEACIGNKHTGCVDVCPVDAFREGPEMLYIDPEACIECNACLTECPERAIFPQSAVPEPMYDYIALNAEKAQIYPVIRESFGHDVAASAMVNFDGRFAVVGSGPSGFYAAEELLKQMPSAQVDMFERLPTPFGLVRYGVAPDHPRIKSVTNNFETIADNSRFRFFGHVQIGKDIQRQDLATHYDGVIYATGGSKSRELGIPGADQPNVFGSSDFVSWYNGHPDQQGLSVDLSQKTAVVIGIGNVALDIARMLVLPPENLATTDVADQALMQFAHSNVEEVYLLARRGPAQAAFTPKELEQLMAIPELALLVDPIDLELDADTEALLRLAEHSEAQQNLSLLREIAQRQNTEKNNHTGAEKKRIHFKFHHTPQSITANAAGQKQLNIAHKLINREYLNAIPSQAAVETINIDARLIVHAIGYQGVAIAGVPFDEQQGIIINEQGEVAGTKTGDLATEYVAGWIKRGASGVIGSNKQCAHDTVTQLLTNLEQGHQQTGRIDSKEDIEHLLKQRNVPYFNFADWRLLDAHEQAQGRAEGRPRRKVTDITQMLSVITQGRADEQAQAQLPVKTHLRTCTLCEAMCGVIIKHQGDKILSIAGDPDDPHSQGHICPKGYSLQDLHNDPDRLKTPLQKVDGQWRPIGWDEALDIVSERLVAVQNKHGADAVAAYWGNPSSHNFGLLMATGKFRKALGTKNISTAASLDQMPHQLMSHLMFGHGQVFTIPDIDRTDYMLMLGANPAASNGSLMSSGDVLKRLEAISERGGKLVLIDPRKTESAIYASEHQFIRPGTDPLFLIGLIQHLLNNQLFDPLPLTPMLDDYEQLLGLFNTFSMADISQQCGIAEHDITRIAEEFAASDSAICYGRMGISTQQFSALNHWLINILNILTGNLDRPGGMMFTSPAIDLAIKPSTAGSFANYGSRVRGLPEFNREFPAAVMAEEMLTPGEGQVRAFVCIAGNPVLSTPNGRQLDKGLDNLDFMVSIDFFLNETSRHADIILPPTGPLEHEQFDLVFNLLAVRNVAKFAEPLFEPGPELRSDWDIIQGITQRINTLKNGENSAKQQAEMSPEQLIDFGLRSGPYGQRFKAYSANEGVEQETGLNLEILKQYPHGLDLGPLQPRLPEHLFTKNKKIQLVPTPVKDDLQRLEAHFFDTEPSTSFILIGRRDLRTNNSWMHNSQRLIKGKDRCALLINPQDAKKEDIDDKSRIRIISRVGELEVDVRHSDDVMPGVVSLPHGWGHDREGVGLRVAQTNPGVSANDLTDDQDVDGLSGNAVFNGVPVQLQII